MKCIFIIAVVFLIHFNNAVAQKIHFTDSTNYWTTTGADCGFNPISGYYWYTKDTTMHSYEYKFLQGRLIDYGRFDTLYGYWVREDTIANMVYVWFNDTDRILYNYNVLIGDTLNYSYLPYRYKYIDTIFDTISVLINATTYKEWGNLEIDTFSHYETIDSMCYDAHEDDFVEGIGSMFGPLFPINTIYGINYWEILQCFHTNDTPAFYALFRDHSNLYSVFTNCDSTTGIKSIRKNKFNTITVFPNPATTILNFQFSTPVDATIKITNIEGQVLQTVQVNSATMATLNIASYAPGMYLYQVVTKAETRVGKVVKE